MKQTSSYTPRQPVRRLIKRSVSALIIIVFFLVGYNSMTASTQSCSAQYSITPPIPGAPLQPTLPSPCGCAGFNTVPCTIPGSTAILTAAVEAAYYSALTASAVAVENYISMAVDTLVQTVFSRLEQVEQDLADWFDTYWYYNYRPSLQAMTEQANVAGMDQAQQTAAITDAEQQNRASLEVQAQDARSAIGQSDTAGEESCAVATSAGGLGNANAFSRAMRRAWQNDSNGAALNRRGSAGARGPAAMVAVHAQEFENLFCNPDDNGGQNVCGASDPQFYNADTQVTGRLYNTLTIPVDKDERHLTTLQHMFDNMLGRPMAAPIAGDAITGSSGQQNWIDRRPMAARKNAARSVLNLIAGWRVPGGVYSDGQNCTGPEAGSAAANPTIPPAAAPPAGPAPAAAAPAAPATATTTRGTAILAMGTNGDASYSSRNVAADTTTMINRLRQQGYRVVVVLPVNTRIPGNAHDFPAYNAAVRQAATAAGISDVITPTAFNPGSDGYHISASAGAAILRSYPDAITVGDSNAEGIGRSLPANRNLGLRGRTTRQILNQTTIPPANGTPTTTTGAPAAAATPFDGTCSFVAAMRQGAGVPLQDLSDNPSYREILHAMSIDRFNSGAYAIDKIGTAERQQMEKVVLNAMYLMQLRDYYELLERTALTLAVQVSVMADQTPLPTATESRRSNLRRDRR